MSTSGRYDFARDILELLDGAPERIRIELHAAAWPEEVCSVHYPRSEVGWTSGTFTVPPGFGWGSHPEDEEA